MRTTTDFLRRAALCAFLSFAALPVCAQGAFLSASSLEADPDAPGEFLYRLELAYDGGRPSIDPRIGVDETPEGIEIMSILAKPLGKGKSEIFIRFRASDESGSTFPEIVISWMAENLVIPPRAFRPLPEKGGSPGAGDSPPGARSEPEWKIAARLPAGHSARAVGNFSVKASLDRERAAVGDIVYLEFLIDGEGDFARALPPSALVVSGKARIGQARRYPDYDAASGRGSLLFRFPVELDGAGPLSLRVDSYPVFHPGSRSLERIGENVFALDVAPFSEESAASDEGGSGISPKGAGAAIAFRDLMGLIAVLSLCLGLIGMEISLRTEGIRRRIARRASLLLFLVSVGLGAAWTFVPGIVNRGNGYFRLRDGALIYAVPSEKGRSWSQTGAYARITGKAEAEGGVVWLRVLVKDSGEGWIRSEDSGEPIFRGR